MTEERIIEMMSRIDDYVKGRLCQDQIDELWVELLKEPYWYRIFKIEVNLRTLIKDLNAGRAKSPFR